MRGAKGERALHPWKRFRLSLLPPPPDLPAAPPLGEFPNVCHPLSPFLLHGQCLSDRSRRQSHGNRDGFTVAGNPCRIYRLHSSGYVFLYLSFRIFHPSPPGTPPRFARHDAAPTGVCRRVFLRYTMNRRFFPFRLYGVVR